MKKQFEWAKTLLCVYRYLERIAGAIDKIMLKKALASGHVSTLNFCSCEETADELINLLERKVTLINLKVLVEDCLSGMRQKDAVLLVNKFVDGVKLRELVEKNGSSLRNIFRKIDNALVSFECQLRLHGYDDERLEKEIQNEEWIKSVFRRFQKCEQEVVLSDIALARAVR